MKKLVTAACMAVCAASLASAVTVKASTVMEGSVMEQDTDKDHEFHLFHLNDRDQKDEDSLLFEINGERAGAYFRGFYKYTDKDGKEALYYMGCYGIGVSRTLAALYEHCLINDSKWGPCGFSLPEEIAPYKIQIVPKMDNEEKVKQGNELYQLLNKEGIGCILDDRENLNIGAKIKDCKVLGTPYLVVLGDKSKENEFEIESIKTGEKEIFTLEELIKRFK